MTKEPINLSYKQEIEQKVLGIPLYMKDGIYIARQNKEFFLNSFNKYILNLAKELGIRISLPRPSEFFDFDNMSFSIKSSTFENEVDEKLFLHHFNPNEVFVLFINDIAASDSYKKIYFEVR